jgi:hypothetical protein
MPPNYTRRPKAGHPHQSVLGYDIVREQAKKEEAEEKEGDVAA